MLLHPQRHASTLVGHTCRVVSLRCHEPRTLPKLPHIAQATNFLQHSSHITSATTMPHKRLHTCCLCITQPPSLYVQIAGQDMQCAPADTLAPKLIATTNLMLDCKTDSPVQASTRAPLSQTHMEEQPVDQLCCCQVHILAVLPLPTNIRATATATAHAFPAAAAS